MAEVHVCSNCGCELVKWMGRCPTCRQWNSLQEKKILRSTQPLSVPSDDDNEQQDVIDLPDYDVDESFWMMEDNSKDEVPNFWQQSYPPTLSAAEEQDEVVEDRVQNVVETRHVTERLVIQDDKEFNTAIGGGIHPGSLIRLTGAPGVGKTTLAIQIALSLIRHQRLAVWYIVGWENGPEVASRAAEWLGTSDDPSLELLTIEQAHASLQAFLEAKMAVLRQRRPGLIILDSVPLDDKSDSTLTLLLRLKETNIPVIFVASMAIQDTLLDCMDCILSLESFGDGLVSLRSLKNRFGSTVPVGLYERADGGRLLPMTNCSTNLSVSWSGTQQDNSTATIGCAVAPIALGSRVFTAKVQALVAPSSSRLPTVQGDNILETHRILRSLAILQKIAGLSFVGQDVFTSAVGPMRSLLKDQDADLAIIISLASSCLNVPVRSGMAFVGRVELTGALQPIKSPEVYVQLADAMGFRRIITPFSKEQQTCGEIEWIQCKTLLQALRLGLANWDQPSNGG